MRRQEPLSSFAARSFLRLSQEHGMSDVDQKLMDSSASRSRM